LIDIEEQREDIIYNNAKQPNIGLCDEHNEIRSVTGAQITDDTDYIQESYKVGYFQYKKGNINII
jgi:hypothetical protein